MRPLNAKMGGDSLSQLRIHSGHTRLAVHRQEAVPLGKRFKFLS
jgi:hypothetical protein